MTNALKRRRVSITRVGTLIGPCPGIAECEPPIVWVVSAVRDQGQPLRLGHRTPSDLPQKGGVPCIPIDYLTPVAAIFRDVAASELTAAP